MCILLFLRAKHLGEAYMKEGKASLANTLIQLAVLGEDRRSELSAVKCQIKRKRELVCPYNSLRQGYDIGTRATRSVASPAIPGDEIPMCSNFNIEPEHP